MLHDAIVGSVTSDPAADSFGGIAATVLNLPISIWEEPDDILFEVSPHPVITGWRQDFINNYSQHD